jgi:hypothetical protein
MRTNTKQILLQWQTVIVSALSYIHFAEQNLSNPELAVLLDGWIAWATANAPTGLPEEQRTELLQAAFTAYNTGDKNRAIAYRRVADVMKNRESYRPE